MPAAVPAAPSRIRAHVALAAMLAAVLALLALAPSAFADALTPESGGSPNANDIDTLYKIVFAFGILIFLLVEGVLIYSLVKFRKRRGAQPPAQIRGNTPLEVSWTIGAAVILVIIAIATFVLLGDIKNPQASKSGVPAVSSSGLQFASVDQPAPPGGQNRSLTINVVGQQYLWRYDYPGRDRVFSYYELVVPAGTTVSLNITSPDVVHSWWVPNLGGKADATPGYTNKTWFRMDKPGVYDGVCAELCGDNHADMRTRVRALPPEEYRAWYQRQARDIKAAQAYLSLSRRVRGEGQ